MNGLVLAVTLGVLAVAAVLRAGASSLVQTSRADALRDSADGVAGARRVAGILEHRDRIVPGVNVVHLMLVAVAALAAAWYLHAVSRGPARIAALAGAWVFLVAVGDLLPRALGRRHPRRIAYRLSGLLRVSVAMGTRFAEIFPAENGGAEAAEPAGGEAEEEEEEIELISSVIEFSETIVREVMVPRTDMVAVDVTASLEELMRLVAEHGYSRFPVVRGDVDEVVGMVIVKDLLPLLTGGERAVALEGLMRPVDFVPETKRVSDLLREMQATKTHLVVVVDEHGSVAGLVTIEDLLEELVGEIVDEYDEHEPLVAALGDGVWQVDGRLPVSELSEVVGVDLPEEDWDTVAGLVLGLAGRVPVEGERFEVGEVAVTALRIQGRRIATVRVERTARVEAGSGNAG
jgi:CBS domain containing-hemolysin-like protein